MFLTKSVFELTLFDVVVPPAVLFGLATLRLTKVCSQKFRFVQKRIFHSTIGGFELMMTKGGGTLNYDAGYSEALSKHGQSRLSTGGSGCTRETKPSPNHCTSRPERGCRDRRFGARSAFFSPI